SFFDALVANKHWINTTTLADAVENVAPIGQIYLPDGSYREMTEWALPVTQQVEYDRVIHDFEKDPRFPSLRQFLRGGFWRNFKVKYPEANEMYARMMMVSRRLAQAENQGLEGETLDHARTALYRGQCNCPYWHGAFGGIYLPHLRNAIYNQLIAADNLIDQAAGRSGPWCEATVDDYNFDSRQEVRLANDKLVALLAPSQGGQLYELDVRTICHNLGATLARREEAYHHKVLAGPASGKGDVASIHDRDILANIIREDQQYQRVVSYEFRGPRKLGDRVKTAVVKNTALQPGFSIEDEQDWRWSNDDERQMYQVIIFAIILIFVVCAALFESIAQPIVILLTVPMALIGVFLLFWLSHASFTREAYVGVVMMSGIVVNSAILLVDRVNQMRRYHGLGLVDALVEGSAQRTRPILMTTTITVVGLLPLVLFSENADANIWNAVGFALIGGLTTSTILVLFVTPCLYLLFERRRETVPPREPALVAAD
ncbi:MAG TPA: efflux RND transporter permease subunit, partial [Longimicrobiales bacterium]|nr:efflux RND transporter permease subunit [Longimicrobiales bacterium]